MCFPSALLRRKGSCERQSCQQLLLQAQEELAAFQLHWSNEERPLPTAAKGTVHSDSVENRVWTEPHRGSPRSEENTTDEVKQATAPYPDDITRAAHVLVGRISMPQTPLALMGDGEVWFPGHPHTPEPAAVSGFHRLHWLGRRSTTAEQLQTLAELCPTSKYNSTPARTAFLPELRCSWTGQKHPICRQHTGHTQGIH